MQLGILPVSLFGIISSGKMSIAEWAKLAQDAGADGYDVSTLFWHDHTPTFINAVKRELDERGVVIRPNMVCTYPDFTNPSDVERRRQLDYLRRDIALASAFGFRSVRITAGMAHPGLDFDAACDHVADCFRQAQDDAQFYGIQLVFENHAKPGAWPLIDFSFDPNAFLDICDRIAGTGIGVNFDTANAVACGTDPVKLLRQVAPLVRTVHINDTATVGNLSPVMIGTGIVDLDRIMRELHAIDFDGWVSIEEASGMGEDGIRKAVAAVRRYIPA